MDQLQRLPVADCLLRAAWGCAEPPERGHPTGGDASLSWEPPKPGVVWAAKWKGNNDKITFVI